jgi:hypothetical protein
MICAICHYLARGQEVRAAVTVVAGYASCEPHFAIAEIAGKAEEGIGLAALESEADADCGRCGRFLGSELGALPEGPDQEPLCIGLRERLAVPFHDVGCRPGLPPVRRARPAGSHPVRAARSCARL